MNPKTAKKKLEQLEAERLVRDRIAAESRARSITVGTAFGGTTEISMRSDSGQNLWCLMQPVEVVELIHQLAANVGCHIALKPRKDFAAWRDWRVDEEEKLAYNGWAPFVNDMAPYNQLGAQGMNPEVLMALEAGGKLTEANGGSGAVNGNVKGQPGAKVFDETSLNRSKENAMAIEKLTNRRSAKRATKAA